MNEGTRAPKQLGDFGEGLVTYTLIRKGYEVAYVDHVGADLIAEKNGKRYAISVKTRTFRSGTRENHMVVIAQDNLTKLQYFADRFALIPLFAQVACIADTQTIHVFMMLNGRIPSVLRKVQHGYSLSFGRRSLPALVQLPDVDYSCWQQECIGAYDFDQSPSPVS